MNKEEKLKLVESMKQSAPRQAQPVISREEMEGYPCNIQPMDVEVPGQVPVKIYLTVPRNKKEKAPLFVNYHGGGFIRGRSDRDELFCRRLAVTFGAVVLDVDYSLAPEYPFPTAVEQARAAALWAKNQAETLGCDPDKLLLLGQSAGGNLVANVCMEELEQPAVRPLCAMIAYAPLDMNTDPGEKYHPERDMPAERARNYNALYCGETQGTNWKISPLFAPLERLKGFPKTLVITAEDDSLAPEGEEFALRLIRAGVEVTAKRFPGSVHGFFINRMDDWEEGVAMIHRYLAQVLKEAEV